MYDFDRLKILQELGKTKKKGTKLEREIVEEEII